MRSFISNDLLWPEVFRDGTIPKSKIFSCNLASTTLMVSAILDKRIRVHGAVIGVASAASFALWAGSVSVMLGPLYFSGVGNMVLPFQEVPYCQTSHNQILYGWETAAAIVTGVLIYTEED
jgi:hypothetical protein